MKQRFARLGALVLLFLLAACAGMLPRMDPPRLSVAGIDFIDANLFEQRFLVKLRIQNPNEQALPVNALSFELDINGKSFATGITNEAVTIAAYGTDVVTVQAFTNTLGISRQINEFARKDLTAVTYRLRGTARVGPGSSRLNFDEKGDIEIPAFFAREHAQP